MLYLMLFLNQSLVLLLEIQIHKILLQVILRGLVFLEDYLMQEKNIFDREHQIGDPKNRMVRTLGVAQLIGDEPEEWF